MCQKNRHCYESIQDGALLVSRLVVGAIFIFAGYGKLAQAGMTAGWFGSIGFPMPLFWVYLVGITEVVAGALVILGVLARHAAMLLSLVMVVALLTVHRSGSFKDAFAPLALLAYSLALAVSGSGKFSLMDGCCPRCMEKESCRDKEGCDKKEDCCGGGCEKK